MKGFGEVVRTVAQSSVGPAHRSEDRDLLRLHLRAQKVFFFCAAENLIEGRLHDE